MVFYAVFNMLSISETSFKFNLIYFGTSLFKTLVGTFTVGTADDFQRVNYFAREYSCL